MKNHIIKSKKSTLDDKVVIKLNGKDVKVTKKDIKVYSTEDGGFQYFIDDEKICNLILGFKLDNNIEIIKVYSSSLKKDRLCFELEIDSDLGYDENYRDSIVESLKYVTITIEENGAIKFYSKPDKKWFSLREGMVFKYKDKNYTFKDEFQAIKVWKIANEEEIMLHEIKAECR